MAETIHVRPRKDVFISNLPVEVHEQFKAQAAVFGLTAAAYLERLVGLDRVAAKAVRAMAAAREAALA